MVTESTIDSRKEILDLLKDLQAHYSTYHNHKETVAWAGVVLFSGLMVGVASLFRDRVSQAEFSCQARAIVSLIVIVAVLVVCLYVYKQFALRKRAADLVAACIRLRSGLVSAPSSPINAADWAALPKPSSGMQSSDVLPQKVLTTADELSAVGQASRILLEACAYAILVFTSAAIIARLWITG